MGTPAVEDMAALAARVAAIEGGGLARVAALEGVVAPMQTAVQAMEGIVNPLAGFVRTEMPNVRVETNLLHDTMQELTAQLKAAAARAEMLHSTQTELSNRVDTGQQSVLALRTEVLEVSEEMSKARSGSSGMGARNKGVDPRSLLPGTYKPAVDDCSKWRDWSYKARSYLGKAVDPALVEILLKVEVRKEEVKFGDLASLGTDPSWEIELRAFLNSSTEGDAFGTVRSGEKQPALEVWRQLADGSDPISEGRLLNDMSEVLDWPRCKDVK